MIHKYSMNGLHIVLDVNSGAVHIVDKVVYDVLDFYKDCSFDEICEKLGDSYSEQELKEACIEIEQLEKDKMLFSEDVYAQVIPKIERRDPVVKALCLHIAHDCNLKCRYCFAEEGEYHGKRELMSLEVGKKAIDFLIKASGKRRNLEVDFFGGEPLMNFGVVKGIVEYARSIEKEHNKNFRFTITTNGILLNDEIMDYINKNMHNVVLSLDGRKEVNDRMRPRAGGQGSYDNIVPKFQKLADSRNQTDYYVRGTFTHYNLDFAKDVVYIESAESLERRQMQTVFYDILVKITKLLTPILPHTAEEIWSYLEFETEDYVQLSELPEAEDFAGQDALLEKWNAFMDFRGQAQKALEEARNEKVIGKSLEAHLTIYPDAEVKELLEGLNTNLAQLLIVSALTIAEGDAPESAVSFEGVAFTVERAEGDVCDRCRRIDPTTKERSYNATICDHCASIVEENFAEGVAEGFEVKAK